MEGLLDGDFLLPGRISLAPSLRHGPRVAQALAPALSNLPPPLLPAPPPLYPTLSGRLLGEVFLDCVSPRSPGQRDRANPGQGQR